MRFGLLGPLEVRAAGVPLELHGAVRRRLLAILLLHPNQAVTSDRLAELTWGGDPPATARNVLQVHVGTLRRALAEAEPKSSDSRIETTDVGYRLRVEPGELDSSEFEQRLHDARRLAADDPAAAAAELSRAGAIWRGEPLADINVPGELLGAVARLVALRDSARALSFELGLRLGRADQLIGDLQAAVADDPTDERWLGLLVRALYASNRQADALAAYRTGRNRLVEELGLDPSPELQQLEGAILRQDPTLESVGGLSSARLVRWPVDDDEATLPTEVSSFVGREADLARVLSMIMAGARLVSITGVGGAGKSRLARRLAALVVSTFDNGARWVDLAPLTAGDHVPEAIATAVGIREQPGRPIFDSLLGALRDRNLLLILDNCEPHQWHVAHVTEALLDACPRLVVLATSREPMRLAAETVWPLEGLQQPESAVVDATSLRATDAVNLFLDRGARANPRREIGEEELPDVAAIVRRVDGLPLAIEMAAAMLRAMGPREIAARLTDGQRLLGLSGGTSKARHRTLEAAIDSSYRLLGPAEQVLLRCLSVFAGAASLEAIEAVCGQDVPDPAGLIASLVDRSLVAAAASASGDGTRYRLLETIREYGRVRLHDTGEDSVVIRRHGGWCLDLAEGAYRRRIADEAASIRVLNAEIDELRLALDRAAADQPAVGSRLEGLLAWFWTASGRFAEGRARDTAGLGDATSRVDRARLLMGLGTTSTMLGESSGAGAIQESVAIWHELGEGAEEALALSALGWAHFWPGENAHALVAFRAGVAIARRLGATDLRLRLQAGECQTLVAMGDAAAARRLARALVDAAPIGDLRTAHFGHHFLADCGLLAGDCRTAAREYARALELARALDDPLEVTVELQGVAMAQAGLGHDREALLLAGAADASLLRLGIEINVPFWRAFLEQWLRPLMNGAAAADVRLEGARLALPAAVDLALSLSV